MVKYYNGEMYIIPKEFEEETRVDERKKVLDEVYAIALNENYDTLIEWLQNNIID